MFAGLTGARQDYEDILGKRQERDYKDEQIANWHRERLLKLIGAPKEEKPLSWNDMIEKVKFNKFQQISNARPNVDPLSATGEVERLFGNTKQNQPQDEPTDIMAQYKALGEMTGYPDPFKSDNLFWRMLGLGYTDVEKQDRINKLFPKWNARQPGTAGSAEQGLEMLARWGR